MIRRNDKHRRKGVEWYECAMCGVEFPRGDVIVQLGHIRCLRNCVDQPGRDPLSRGYPLRTESSPPPLPEDRGEV